MIKLINLLTIHKESGSTIAYGVWTFDRKPCIVGPFAILDDII